MGDSSTIVVSKVLKKELDGFKDFDRETYADVIQKLVHRARQDDESKLELSSAALKAIAAAKKDIKAGRVFSSKQLAQELGF
ncbi:MAG: hypothetical protein Q7R47_05875 [Candidatus Diapherotrites archaeon]|nr:hypothetical protein [Candidatus Diapherotrites archaeon]